jgi:probable F420-dependent oxidoreductase
MGEASKKETLLGAVRLAEKAEFDDIWIQDHLAIPPDDAEGSDGRYLDPLTTLAWLAASTDRIGLGTGVLILPYRSALPTAKSIATVQELSGGRLLLGVGVGWMQPEFDALGLSRSRRGRDTNRALDLIRRSFSAEDDIVEENGQSFLFRPNPPMPPIYIGGHGRHALERVVRYGDGWMPMGGKPADLQPQIEQLRELAQSAGRSCPEVICLGGLPLGDPVAASDQLHALGELGVTRFICGGGRYTTVEEFKQLVDGTTAIRAALD